MKNIYFSWLNKGIYYLVMLTLIIIVGLNVIDSRGFETVEQKPLLFSM